jgi:hypothetical protein
MTCNSVKFRRGIYLAALMAWGLASARGQSAPPVQEILNRLDRLEKNNEALLEEVRALRQEISTLRTPGVEAAAGEQPLVAPEPTAAERQAVQQSRIEELAQSKVETSERFPLRITGMVLFNALLNGQKNNNADNPTTASLAQGDLTGEGTLRQSTLGFLFHGPRTFLGGQVSGSFYMDFFGGSTMSLNHLLRIRTAAVNLDWTHTSVMVGQDKPMISPRDPDSLAQVGVSPLTGAGNLWLWQPQVRVEQRFSIGQDSGARAQFAVFQTSRYDFPSVSTGYHPPPEEQMEYSRPGIEGRFELWHRWGGTERVEIAGGFHYNRNHVQTTDVPSEVFSVDWFARPMAKLEFSGMFFHGQNAATLGALPGFTVFDNGSIVPVHSTGGWAQIRVPITTRLAFNVYGGQQDERRSDLLNGVGKNQAYFSNLMYRLAPNVIVSLEGGQVRTTYLGFGNRLNDHYDLALAYLF